MFEEKRFFIGYKPIFRLATLILSLILTICSLLGNYIILLPILALFLVVCPFIFTFVILSLKTIYYEKIENKDIYAGYQYLSHSVSYIVKKSIIPIILSIAVFFISFIGLYLIDIFVFEYDFMIKLSSAIRKGYSETQLINLFLENYSFIIGILICFFISTSITIIFFNVIYNRKMLTYAFFLATNNRMINYDYIIEKKNYRMKNKDLSFDIKVSFIYICGIFLALIVNIFIPIILSVIDVNNSLEIPNFLLNVLSTFIIYYFIGHGIAYTCIHYCLSLKKNYNDEIEKLKRQADNI